MAIPYDRAMLFLTCILGGYTIPDHLGELLNQQTINNHVNVNNPWLWDSVALAFNCQYADKLHRKM